MQSAAVGLFAAAVCGRRSGTFPLPEEKGLNEDYEGPFGPLFPREKRNRAPLHEYHPFPFLGVRLCALRRRQGVRRQELFCSVYWEEALASYRIGFSDGDIRRDGLLQGVNVGGYDGDCVYIGCNGRRRRQKPNSRIDRTDAVAENAERMASVYLRSARPSIFLVLPMRKRASAPWEMWVAEYDAGECRFDACLKQTAVYKAITVSPFLNKGDKPGAQKLFIAKQTSATSESHWTPGPDQ
ncbi:hypothetical protein B0H13DRAFT_1852280 [Mycena leptocephala]|nr:hypothetical protein B0H13DRAFT_1852280 [Mycena leptocephala]